MEIRITCPCGTEMQLAQWQVGRKKYCSNDCKYRYRTRPSGLTYDIKVANKAWFQPGEVHGPVGEDHPQWKGDQVSYRELHRWVARHKAKSGSCEECGVEALTQWANKSHEYLRDLDDWMELCRKCHGRHDSGWNWGLATDKYGALAVQGG